MQQNQKRAVICWHRRSGKDKTCLNILIWQIINNESKKKPETYYYFFPTFAQGRKALWDAIDKDGFKFMDHFPKNMICKIIGNEMKIVTEKGSVFQIIGTENYDSIMGTNPVGCVFSEYSLQNPKAWDFIRPILAENGGWAIFNFTPRGTNHAHTLLQQGREAGWFTSVLTVEDTRVILDETIEAERLQMPPALFEQEYFCKFINGANQYFRKIDENILSETSPVNHGHRYVIGVDLGKYNSYTVLTPFDLHTFQVGTPDRFRQIDYPTQEARIEAMHRRYNKALVRIDSTGAGDPVYDHLKRKIRSIEGFRFTEQTRKDLLENLRLQLEEGKIKLPNDETLIAELRSVQYDLTETGKLAIRVPSGMHDDCVMSLALAVCNIPANPLRIFQDQKDRHETLAQFDFYKRSSPKDKKRRLKTAMLIEKKNSLE